MTSDTKISPVASSQRHDSFPRRSSSPSSNSSGHGGMWTSFEKLGVPVNRLINKVGSEAFWPTGLDEESEKAARILRSFCKDGVVTEQPERDQYTAPSPQDIKPEPKSEKHELSIDTNVNEKTPLVQEASAQQSNTTTPPNLPPRVQKSIRTIPPSVIHNALGLAIFTVFRLGTWGAAFSAGSGVLVARDPETRKWSSPSALGASTIGVGLMAGLDVVDCLIVINTPEALDRFKGIRWSMGGDVAMTLGPWGAGGAADYGLGRDVNLSAKEIEAGVKKEKGKFVGKPVYVYTKSRGLYAGLTLDGTVIGVRSDENAKFYGGKVEVSDILAGRVRRWTDLSEVLEEIEESPRQVRDGLGTQIREAPVLLEFVDRRGQRRGSDGAWVDVASEFSVEREEKAVIDDLRRAEEQEWERKLDVKKAEEKAWQSGDTYR